MLRTLARELKLTNFSNGLVKKRSSRFYATVGGRRLEGKIAIITGSASGLGKATAHEFVQHGAQVIIADNDTQLGPKVAKELGHSAQYVECDVTVEAQVEEAVNFAITNYGKLDIMYNNAGITGPVIPPSITELDLDEFEKVMRINVTGVIAGIKHAARVMIPKGYGSIICTSSISGLFGGLGPHPYTISKSTIPGVVKSVASELCGAGIRVNCISPTAIPTPMSLYQIGKFIPGVTYEQIGEIVSGLSALKGAKCEDIDVARAALYLASDDAKFISGQNLIVDGGFTSIKNFAFPSPDQIG
ncbi:putative xanthoxin dehydrogenase [Medicago truncatula]|uniref:Putative xanthoxin dehydrogenase n=2 Tax=Medicago truncatula TaxID=3880 RepID=Q2HUL4_MEDTR|nr:zerumbone synthase [Medicago truncatula]ABD32552.1 Short-chain dehydrogenase/reductase SDR [Medicago truncatula]AES80704.1 short-chain dehydrogenase/reductase [Medicago truncatula]AFK44649.1 unknown [Medicago truncatula]RHN47349.1 putative xanthoxin dehydrogenase [Medicago truncatula]